MSEETIPQMRERIGELEKNVKALEKSNGELSIQNRTFQAREVARDQGYSPSTGDLFAKVQSDGDITAEALAAFASEHGLKPVEESTAGDGDTSEEADGVNESDTSTSLGSMSGGSSSSGAGGQQATGSKTMTRQEYHELQANDPVAARQAVMDGRVQLRSDNPLAARS